MPAIDFRAIRPISSYSSAALEDAGLTPADIDYVNVHGTSTPIGDPQEIKAIQEVFGEDAYRINISSTKSMTGHLLGASGSLEAAICAKVINENILPATMNYETPEGQRPTISSYLIWAAGQRQLKGASMWVPIPFYLTSLDDPQSWRTLLEFFDKRFGLNLDFADLDQAAARQNERLSQARSKTPELDEYLKRLETNQPLNQEDNEKLVREIEEILKDKR